MATTVIKLDRLVSDPELQARAYLRSEVVAEYSVAMMEEATFPPLDIFAGEGEKYLIADGHHRYQAALKAGQTEITVRVHPGDRRDAILFAASSNITHGVQRSDEDKRQAVEMLLTDPDWATWSNVRIGKHCGVSEAFVRKIRGQLPFGEGETAKIITVQRGSSVYQMTPPRRDPEPKRMVAIPWQHEPAPPERKVSYRVQIVPPEEADPIMRAIRALAAAETRQSPEEWLELIPPESRSEVRNDLHAARQWLGKLARALQSAKEGTESVAVK